MSGFADFGPLVTEVDVDEAVIRRLRLWLPTYLAQVETERGVQNRRLARPKPESYANTLDDDEFLDHQLPAVIVTTAATDEPPTRDGDGNYYAAWRVVVSTIVRGEVPTQARAVASLFGASVRRALIQDPSLGGFSSDLVWTSGNVAPVADVTDNGRYLAAGINEFVVHVDNVAAFASPPLTTDPVYEEPDPELPDDPYNPLATVAGVTVTIQKAGS